MIADIPNGYSLRAARSDDLAPIGELLTACDIDDCGHDDFINAEWLGGHAWALPRFDFADTWVAHSRDGIVAAYAHIHEEIPGSLVEAAGWVHPAHRGRGLGQFLVQATEARFRHMGVSSLRLHNVIFAGDAPAREILTSRGYGFVRRFLHMEADLDETSRAPRATSGVTIRTFRATDERNAHEALETAFEQHWEFAPTPFEEWRDDNVAQGWFDPELCFLATLDDAVLGVLVGREDQGKGFVVDLGVLAHWRGRGIGSNLLRHAFDEFLRRGLSHARLNVNSANETGAVAVYESIGMRAIRTWDAYEKAIVGAGA